MTSFTPLSATTSRSSMKTERLVIELADAMATAPANVRDDLYARLREQFSEEQLMQLSAQIGVRKLSRTLEPRFRSWKRRHLSADRSGSGPGLSSNSWIPPPLPRSGKNRLPGQVAETGVVG